MIAQEQGVVAGLATGWHMPMSELALKWRRFITVKDLQDESKESLDTHWQKIAIKNVSRIERSNRTRVEHLKESALKRIRMVEFIMSLFCFF